ncbi:MAG TPA: PH domain-containing protein, partial [Thermoanaerobaculia bacterium]|nr:PH domain-containing protein [Thermoanaerobaculia bacterium]
MPVIACPDCSRDVSTLATSCPHCGRPMAAGPDVLPLASAIYEPRPIAAEETLWRGTPSTIVLLGHLFWIALVLIVIPLLARFFADTEPNAIRNGWGIAIVVALLLAIRLLFAYFRIVSTIYTVTNQRVMIERGLLTKSLSEIDLRYIDDSNFSQGAVERLLGIGQVTLISSDKSSPVYT